MAKHSPIRATALTRAASHAVLTPIGQAVLASIFVASGASAQQGVSLKPVVITEHRVPAAAEVSGFGDVPLKDLPLSATVVGQSELLAVGARRLADIAQFETALPEFQAAYQRRQMPWLLINIGRTLHRLGRPREALDHYERFKAAESRPDAETVERLEKYITQAKALADTTPPPPTTGSNPTPSTPAAPVSSSETPLYKKWWFWTAIGGGVVVIAVVAGAAAAASRPSGNGLPDGVTTVKVTF